MPLPHWQIPSSRRPPLQAGRPALRVPSHHCFLLSTLYHIPAQLQCHRPRRGIRLFALHLGVLFARAYADPCAGSLHFAGINIVYRRFPILAEEERERIDERRASKARARAANVPYAPPRQRMSIIFQRARSTFKQSGSDWAAFIASPVFASSLAISLLYLTVLSFVQTSLSTPDPSSLRLFCLRFDGTLLSYLLSHDYSDIFLASMRGLCVITGLLGTVAMPYLEKRIGVIRYVRRPVSITPRNSTQTQRLVRTGTWSILSELVTLIPVVFSFFVGAPNPGERGSPWNQTMLFGGGSDSLESGTCDGILIPMRYRDGSLANRPVVFRSLPDEGAADDAPRPPATEQPVRRHFSHFTFRNSRSF